MWFRPAEAAVVSYEGQWREYVNSILMETEMGALISVLGKKSGCLMKE